MANASVYEIVTDRIVKAIEEGVSPWRKPWAAAGSRFSFNGKPVTGPVNATTGKPYRGVNVLLLSLGGFNDPRWLTFKQAQTLGGTVKKGEKGTPIVFWKWVEVKPDTQTEETGEETQNTPTGKRVPILRYYTVFNVEQCEGFKTLKPLVETKPTGKTLTPIEAAEGILSGNKNNVEVKHGGDKAFYSPLGDFIGMPHVEQFESMEAYYATRFHEEGHATGHGTRLNRPGIVNFNGFGTDTYSREELVAELTSAFLCAVAGIDSNLDQSAAYLKGWLKPLKGDPKMIVIAAGQAQKAADFILGTEAAEEDAD
jgi:antirestriction protein ArdC